MKRVDFYFLILLLLFETHHIIGQPVPAGDENIPYLMTFGPKAEKSWGDDDFSQTFFFVVPKSFSEPLFIRVFDPDVGGTTDELNIKWDTRVIYSVYGGKECYTHPDAQETQPVNNYKSGILLATKTFMEMLLMIINGTLSGLLTLLKASILANLTVMFSRLYAMALPVMTEIYTGIFSVPVKMKINP